MLGQTIAFYLFSSMSILSALFVIFCRNSVHSVLFLILAFFNVAGLFILLHAEFLSMLLMIVYVGAVAVLFLFVVMMLDMTFSQVISQRISRYFPLGIFIAVVLCGEILFVLGSWKLTDFIESGRQAPLESFDMINHVESLGWVLYHDYVYGFILSAFILLVAMIGAIILTQRERTGVKRQNISHQCARNPKTSIDLKDVEFERGV